MGWEGFLHIVISWTHLTLDLVHHNNLKVLPYESKKPWLFSFIIQFKQNVLHVVLGFVSCCCSDIIRSFYGKLFGTSFVQMKWDSWAFQRSSGTKMRPPGLIHVTTVISSLSNSNPSCRWQQTSNPGHLRASPCKSKLFSATDLVFGAPCKLGCFCLGVCTALGITMLLGVSHMHGIQPFSHLHQMDPRSKWVCSPFPLGFTGGTELKSATNCMQRPGLCRPCKHNIKHPSP